MPFRDYREACEVESWKTKITVTKYCNILNILYFDCTKLNATKAFKSKNRCKFRQNRALIMKIEDGKY